jgi:hypothetical protein
MNLSKKNNMFRLGVIFPLVLLALPWTGMAQRLRIDREKIVDLTYAISFARGIWSTVKPPREKWMGASICVPPCSLAE